MAKRSTKQGVASIECGGFSGLLLQASSSDIPPQYCVINRNGMCHPDGTWSTRPGFLPSKTLLDSGKPIRRIAIYTTMTQERRVLTQSGGTVHNSRLDDFMP